MDKVKEHNLFNLLHGLACWTHVQRVISLNPSQARIYTACNCKFILLFILFFLHTKFHKPLFDGSLVTVIKLKTKYSPLGAPILLYNSLEKIYVFFLRICYHNFITIN
jgi:hypothetical protein